MANVSPSRAVELVATEILTGAQQNIESGDGEPLLSILLAALSVEAFFNDLEYLLNKIDFARSSPALDALGTSLSEIEDVKGSTRSKIRISYLVLNGRSFDKGAQPYQDLDLLIRLRDALVHSKPVIVDYEQPRESSNFGIVRGLSSRKLIPKGSEHGPKGWRTQALVPSVARWSFNVALASCRVIVSSLPSGDLNQLLYLSYAQFQYLSTDNAG